MTTKEITLCGQQVKLIYCAASENGFEDLSGKSINDLDFTKSKDILNLSLACIVAAYTAENQEPPIKSEDILYDATPQEISELLTTVIMLRVEWYTVPDVVKPDMKPDTKGRRSKNAQPPTTSTKK